MCSASGLVECVEPGHAVGDDAEDAPSGWHVVGVAGGDGFPGVPCWVGGGEAEGFGEPVLPVGAVVGKGLTGPFAGDQDPASGVAEVFAAVCLALAGARTQSGAWVPGLDAVAEPVRARRGAGFVAQRARQAVDVGGWSPVG